MTGEELRNARMKKGWKQVQAARKLGMTQGYLSMLERGRRALSGSAMNRVAREFDLPPTALPLPDEPKGPAPPNEVLMRQLAALGYPWFAYIPRGQRRLRNPAEVLFTALNEPELEMQIIEALPWLVFRFADLDWDWLVKKVKLHDRQNRLGFTVTLGRELTERAGDQARAKKLRTRENKLEQSKLAREDTYCHDSITEVERVWLREKRTPQARRWNILTDFVLNPLRYPRS